MPSGHFLSLKVNSASPLLLVSFTAIVITIAERFSHSNTMRLGFALTRDEI
jgi:hypothetical protein